MSQWNTDFDLCDLLDGGYSDSMSDAANLAKANALSRAFSSVPTPTTSTSTGAIAVPSALAYSVPLAPILAPVAAAVNATPNPVVMGTAAALGAAVGGLPGAAIGALAGHVANQVAATVAAPVAASVAAPAPPRAPVTSLIPGISDAAARATSALVHPLVNATQLTQSGGAAVAQALQQVIPNIPVVNPPFDSQTADMLLGQLGPMIRRIHHIVTCDEIRREATNEHRAIDRRRREQARMVGMLRQILTTVAGHDIVMTPTKMKIMSPRGSY